MTSAYDFHIHTLLGQAVDLKDYAGQVTLVVNVASQCGFTPQYAGLQALHDQFHARGFSVLAFPCNQFGAQEPGNAEEIAQFCERQYGVTFPVFEKIDVNGAKAHPLYQFLVKQKLEFHQISDRPSWPGTQALCPHHEAGSYCERCRQHSGLSSPATLRLI